MSAPTYSGIGFKMTILVLCGASLVFAVTLRFSYVYTKEIIRTEAEKFAREATLAVANEMEQEFRSVAKIPHAMKAFLESGPCDEERLETLLRTLVSENHELYGAAAAFAPYAFNRHERWFAPYGYRTGGGVAVKKLGSPDYDYFMMDWYHIPKTLKAPVWLDPYNDEGGGGILMTTYALPFYDPPSEKSSHERIRGVLTADISLDRLTGLAQSLQLTRTGFCFIISDRGTFVTFPVRNWIMSESIFSIAEEQGNDRLRKIGQAMVRDKSGFADIGLAMSNKDSFLAYARIPSPGWALGGVFPKSELFAEFEDLKYKTYRLAGFGVLLFLCVSLLIARSISQPLRRMAEMTGRVAHGDLDIHIPEAARTDEVGELARAFMGMSQDLKKYLKDLTQATAAKQRIESELSIAADIQRRMLRSVFPAFPDRDEFDIYAMMRPAKEVGGDFYDFFLIDHDHLCVVVGDVSGKGVPAALFMSGAKYLIEAFADVGDPPDILSARVNRRLADNNESCMFVTAFLAILDLRTGELVYANCGHNPPLILQHGEKPFFMGPPGGPVLGVFEDAIFKADRILLAPGSALLTFTDGVTEAFSADGSMFTEERLLKSFNTDSDGTARGLTDTVLAQVDSFAEGAPQADDITILALRFTPHAEVTPLTSKSQE